MRVEEVLERYVREVANQLPIRMRSDVALELASLLREELRAKAETLGVEPDARLAAEVARDFGHPNEVAARYHPRWAIIDPSDTHNFLMAVIVGGAVVFALSAPAALLSTAKARGPEASLLWWIGVVAVFFAFRSWRRWRAPEKFRWRLKRDPDQVSRMGMIALIVLIGIAMEIYSDPERTFAMLTGNGQLGAWLRYDPVFRAERMPWLFVVWIGQAAMLAVLAIRGRWTPLLRQVEIAISVLTIVLIAWFRSGAVMADATADQTAKAFMAMIGLFLLIEVAVKIYRRAGQVDPRQLREALSP
jgi:hypothetical protein